MHLDAPPENMNAELAREALTAGFDGLEIELPSCQWNLSAVAMSAPVVCVAMGGLVPDVDRTEAEVRSVLKEASTLGARTLQLTIPALASVHCRQCFLRYQDAINYTYKLGTRLRMDAEAAGVSLAVEVCRGQVLLSPVECRELIDALQSPSVGVCLDVARIAPCGSVEDWITTLGRRVLAVRYSVCDEGTPNQPSLSEGAARLAALTHALDEIVYAGPIIVAGAASTTALAEAATALGCRMTPRANG